MTQVNIEKLIRLGVVNSHVEKANDIIDVIIDSYASSQHDKEVIIIYDKAHLIELLGEKYKDVITEISEELESEPEVVVDINIDHSVLKEIVSEMAEYSKTLLTYIDGPDIKIVPTNVHMVSEDGKTLFKYE